MLQESVNTSGPSYTFEPRHFSKSELTDFYSRWVANPASLSEDEFDTVQLHLLSCKRCCTLGQKCEHKLRNSVSHAVRTAA